MAAAPPRTLAAEKALLALLKALPPGGALHLRDGTPAAAAVAGVLQPLGRAPLSRGQVEALLSAPELSDAFAAGPGASRRWSLDMAGRHYAASFEWVTGGPWQVVVADQAPLAPGAEPLSVRTALEGLSEAPPPPPPAPVSPPVVDKPLRTISLATSATPPVAPTLAFGRTLGVELPSVAVARDPAPASGPSSTALPAPATVTRLAPFAAAPKEAGATAGPLPPALVAAMSAARRAGAADLHLQASSPARHRLTGQLRPEGAPLSAELVATFADALVPPSLQALLLERGSVDFSVQDPEAGRFRANVSRQATGLKICLRLVPAEAPSLAELHLPSDVEAVAQYHQGLAIIAGPKGHGKTNTLAAIVRTINERSRVHIITVEDPIEVVHVPQQAVISQRQIGLHTQSFGRALKGALREDPDVIVIGELRDRETVEIALAAAETGHLVLATMSTRSAAKTVDRLIDLFPPDQQQQVRATLAGALKMVVSQRLVPTKADTLLPAIEVMTGSVPLWTLIRENKMFQLPSLQQRGRSIGMVRLDQSLEQLFKEGHIEAETALAFAEERPELQRVLRDKYQVAAVPDAPLSSKGAP